MILVRYITISGVFALLFANFVACGSQFYRVSLEDDSATNIRRSSVSTKSRDQSPTRNSLFGVHSAHGWRDLPIHCVLDYTLAQDQIAGLKEAIRTWEWAVGKKLFKISGSHGKTTGDSFPDLFSSLNDYVNGHYLNHDWNTTGKPREVLATTIWENAEDEADAIVTADIRFNANVYTIGDSLMLKPEEGRPVVDMWSVALHELGHLLGLSHVGAEDDPYSIMNPSLYIGEGLTARRLSMGDLERIQSIYGCEGDACDLENYYNQYEQNGGNINGT